jgi:hypothetical protein
MRLWQIWADCIKDLSGFSDPGNTDAEYLPQPKIRVG